MLKFLSGIAIIVFTTFCGYFLSKKYRRKKLFFQELKAFNERFLSEISYFRRPIREFVASFSYQGEFRLFLESFFSMMGKDSINVWDILNLSNFSFLTEEEKCMVSDYFLMLGKGDSLSQKGYFSSMKEPLLKYYIDAEKDYKRYGDLYVKIGFLCGLLVLILIV